jgi:arylsulfatase A-like enzyme
MPTRLSRICLLLAALGIVSASRAQPPASPGPPNFVVILTDDQGYGDLGCTWTPDGTGEFPRIDTPSIDRLASEGMLLTSFYVSPLCTPTRASLMTGCYPPRIGMSLPDPDGRRGVLAGDSIRGIHHDETTLPELLAARGYVSACVGKWHLGNRPYFRPLSQGFDWHYGPMFRGWGSTRMFRGNDVVEEVRDEDMTRRFTEEAISFLRQHHDRPFFLYMAHTMPHEPVAASESFRGRSSRGLYGDAILELDWSVGEIVRTLQELDLDERTLVVFTMDNGPSRKGTSHPFRGGKPSTLEGGVRVPCILRWPGHVPAGSTRSEIITIMDLLPTFAALAGAPLPSRPIDGWDLWPLVEGDGIEAFSQRPHFYYHLDELAAVRRGPWKLEFTPTVAPSPPRLYDLVADPAELEDVAAEHPDVVDDLARLGEDMRRRLGDRSTGIEGTERRPIGVLPESRQDQSRGEAP